MDDRSILTQLMAVVEERKSKPVPSSYTCQLFAAGTEVIGAKVIEEAQELVDAAEGNSAERPQRVVHEAADLIYHVLVLLGHCGVSLADVESELRRRFGTSGLDEKAARSNNGSV